MKVIVDTSIWSLVLRRRKGQQSPASDNILKLIDESRVVILGPIRQEILSGIKDRRQLNLLKEYLKAFPDLLLETKDYELAAGFFNICRAKGIQGSNTDFLICATAVNNNFSIYTSDKDFILFQKYLPIQLESM